MQSPVRAAKGIPSAMPVMRRPKVFQRAARERCVSALGRGFLHWHSCHRYIPADTVRARMGPAGPSHGRYGFVSPTFSQAVSAHHNAGRFQITTDGLSCEIGARSLSCRHEHRHGSPETAAIGIWAARYSVFRRRCRSDLPRSGACYAGLLATIQSHRRNPPNGPALGRRAKRNPGPRARP